MDSNAVISDAIQAFRLAKQRRLIHIIQARTKPLQNSLYHHSKTIPAPAIPATMRYAESCKRPMSKRGTMTAPAADLLVDVEELEEEPLEPLEEPVPVGAVVTVPVPAVPAWLRRDLQLELVDPDWVLAFPLKSQAVEALPWAE